MDRHDLVFLVEGIISFILIVVLSLFVSSQSANAKETKKNGKKKTVWICIKLLFYLQNYLIKSGNKKMRKEALFMHQQQQIIQSYIVLFVQNEYDNPIYKLGFEYITEYNNLNNIDQIVSEYFVI